MKLPPPQKKLMTRQIHLPSNKNSAEVDIAPAFGEITIACNVGQAKNGHGACLKSGQLVYARVCLGQLLCKVSYSQPSLLQRNIL